jgi:type VI secretion system secreted protein Hcp
MAFDAFLKIDDIPGDATVKTHKDEIEVESYGWGIANAADAGTGGGGGSGKTVLSDFRIVKSVDKSSPLLFAAVCTAEHFPEAVFIVEEMGTPGKKPTSFLKLKLFDVFVSSFQASGAINTPTETVTLGFAKMEIEVAGAKSTSCSRPGTE